jgi:DNA-binding response OmpR family regulator
MGVRCIVPVSTVLVVDDEKNIVELLRLYLSREGYQVEVAYDGQTALEKVRSLRPLLVLLDLMLPDMDGFEVCRQIRKTSNVPIIMLTARGEDVDKIVGLEIGADDYVTKPFNPREVIARLKAVLRRLDSSKGQDEEIVSVGDLAIDVARREVRVLDREVELRAKEFDLLTVLARHPGVVFSRERLLNVVWGYDYYGDSRTIDVHVTWLRDKLQSSSVHIQTVWGVGYKLAVDQRRE